MQKYIERLMKCDYTKERAESVCYNIWLNCGYVALVLFVENAENVA